MQDVIYHSGSFEPPLTKRTRSTHKNIFSSDQTKSDPLSPTSLSSSDRSSRRNRGPSSPRKKSSRSQQRTSTNISLNSMTSRNPRDPNRRISRGAELVRAQLFSTGSQDVLYDLGLSLEKQLTLSKTPRLKHNQEQQTASNSPRLVTQFSTALHTKHLPKCSFESRDNQMNPASSRDNSSVKSKPRLNFTNGYEESNPFHHTRDLPTTMSNDNIKNKGSPLKRKCSFQPAALNAFPPLKIRSDDPFKHAQKAGLLWQTIVGTFLRFPTAWFNGFRVPEMGIPQTERGGAKWNFVCLLRLQDKFLSSYIKDKRSSGKLLLHVIVTDAEENDIRDIAIGCYHPKAKRVFRNNPLVESNLEDSMTDDSYRDVWMALRKVDNSTYETTQEPSQVISPLEKCLTMGQSINTVGRDSPISSNKRSISNENIRSVSLSKNQTHC